MRIVKDGLLKAYAGRMINIHPFLLPSFPGLNGGKQAFDTGAIINQKMSQIENNDTLDTMMSNLHAQEHIAYPEALQWIAEDRIQFDGRRITLR